MTTTITLGRYTVHVGIRHDNPHFPKYTIYRDTRYIGTQFSMPSESDCQWIESNDGYAKDSRSPQFSEGRPIHNTKGCRRKGRSSALKALEDEVTE